MRRGGAEGRVQVRCGRGAAGRTAALVAKDLQRVRGNRMLQNADISIGLNIDTFTLTDSQALEEYLRAETDLRVKSHNFAADTAPGGTLPTDVVIHLYTLAPILRDVYLNVLSSALYDVIRAALSRRGRADSEATFYIAMMDEDENVLREVRGQTSDREVIKDLIRQAGASE